MNFKLIRKQFDIFEILIDLRRQILAAFVALPILCLQNEMATGTQLSKHSLKCQLQSGITEIQLNPFDHRQTQNRIELWLLDVQKTCIVEHIVATSERDIVWKRISDLVAIIIFGRLSLYGRQMLPRCGDQIFVDIQAGYEFRAKLFGHRHRYSTIVATNVEYLFVGKVFRARTKRDNANVFADIRIAIAVISVVIAIKVFIFAGSRFCFGGFCYLQTQFLRRR